MPTRVAPLNSDIPDSHDLFCYACGTSNPAGLRLAFTSQREGQAGTTFTPDRIHQSYTNTLHGGIQSLVIDACMVQALKTLGLTGVTCKLELRYRLPVTLDNVYVEAKVLERAHGFVHLRAELRQNSVLKTSARGIFKCLETALGHGRNTVNASATT